MGIFPGLRVGLTATHTLVCDLLTASWPFRQWLFLPETGVCSKSSNGAKEHSLGQAEPLGSRSPGQAFHQDPSSERATEDRMGNAKMTLLQKVGDYFLRIHAMELHCIFPTSEKVYWLQALNPLHGIITMQTGFFLCLLRKLLSLSTVLVASLFFFLSQKGFSQETPGKGGTKTGVFQVDRETDWETMHKRLCTWQQRHQSKNTFQDYQLILEELSKSDRYLVCDGKNFSSTVNPDRVVVYLRHDIDQDPLTALRMAEEEHKRQLKGSYYVLPGAWYYGRKMDGKLFRYSCMDHLYLSIAKYGHEIGVHNNLLTLMLELDVEPMNFQRDELAYYRQIGLEVSGTVSHGAWINRLGINNTWVFSEFGKKGTYIHQGLEYEYGRHSLRDFGFQYEGYRLKSKHLSDIGEYPGSELPAKLRNCHPGERVSLLIHPCHWQDDISGLKAEAVENRQ